MPHTTKNFSERQYYVHHSSKLISCPNSFNSKILYSRQTGLLPTRNLLPKLDWSLEVTAVLHAFEHCSHADFQTHCLQRFKSVLCTEVDVFMEENIQLARRSPKMYRSIAKTIGFKIIIWQCISYPKVFDSLEFLTWCW